MSRLSVLGIVLVIAHSTSCASAEFESSQEEPTVEAAGRPLSTATIGKMDNDAIESMAANRPVEDSTESEQDGPSAEVGEADQARDLSVLYSIGPRLFEFGLEGGFSEVPVDQFSPFIETFAGGGYMELEGESVAYINYRSAANWRTARELAIFVSEGKARFIKEGYLVLGASADVIALVESPEELIDSGASRPVVLQSTHDRALVSEIPLPPGAGSVAFGGETIIALSDTDFLLFDASDGALVATFPIPVECRNIHPSLINSGSEVLANFESCRRSIIVDGSSRTLQELRWPQNETPVVYLWPVFWIGDNAYSLDSGKWFQRFEDDRGSRNLYESNVGRWTAVECEGLTFTTGLDENVMVQVKEAADEFRLEVHSKVEGVVHEVSSATPILVHAILMADSGIATALPASCI